MSSAAGDGAAKGAVVPSAAPCSSLSQHWPPCVVTLSSPRVLRTAPAGSSRAGAYLIHLMALGLYSAWHVAFLHYL